MKCIIVRHGEISIKSSKVRSIFENKLVNNIKKIVGDVRIKKIGPRIYLYGENLEEKGKALKRVFGVASYSMAEEINADLEEIKKEVEKLASKSKRIKIESKRISKEFPLTSPEINREIGKVLDEKGYKIDIKEPEEIIRIEINRGKAYIFKKIHKCFGGLPVGASGKIGAKCDKKENALAGLLLMKRGCTPVIVKSGKFEEIIQKYAPRKIEKGEKAKLIASGETEVEEIKKKEKVEVYPLIGLSKEEIEKMWGEFNVG